MKKWKSLSIKKVILYIVIGLLGVASFWLVQNGLYYHKKYISIRKMYKEYDRNILNQISAYFPKGSIVLAPKGGLGNQLFQYAAAYNLAKQTDSKLYVLATREEKNKTIKENTSIYDRNFALHHFIPAEHIVFKDEITQKPTRLIVKSVNDENFFQFKGKKNNAVLYMSTYFESEIYFEEVKDEIRSILSLDPLNFIHLEDELKDISAPNSYCVHMRKGDMLRGNYMYYLHTDYQKQAIDFITHTTDKPKFFVFSDSPEVAKRELKNNNIEFFSNKQLEDFWLMSHCANNIVANSTFSWWAAYLNKNESKTIIAPYHRYHNFSYHYLWENKNVRYNIRRLYENSAYPKDWILIDHEKPDLVNLVKRVVPESGQLEILKHYKEKPFDIYSGDGVELSLCKNKESSKSHICQAEHGKTAPTVVTSYFDLQNKTLKKAFDDWGDKFLNTPFNLVVFTDKANAKKIKKLRGDLPITIVEKELKDLYHYKYYDQYKEMYNVAGKTKGHSPEMYVIHSEKVKFVNEAINLDPYKSNYFIWMDIGTTRQKEFVEYTSPVNTYMTTNKMSFFAIEDFSSADIISKAPPYFMTRMAGNVQVGDKFAWKLYNHLWDKVIESYLEKSFMITSDQALIGGVVLTYPEIARIIYPDIRYTGSLWWYSLLYLSDSEDSRK